MQIEKALTNKRLHVSKVLGNVAFQLFIILQYLTRNFQFSFAIFLKIAYF